MGYCAKNSGNSLSETSVRNYHYSLRNNTDDRSSHLLRCGNLNSSIPDGVGNYNAGLWPVALSL